jgi:hypothetical protein
MLSAINERMPTGNVDFQLHSIIQKGNHLQIVGSAPNQQTLSDFFHQLEFSNGLFGNLVLSSIEGREVQADGPDRRGEEGGRLFRFTIDCDYNKPHDAGSEESKAAGGPVK